MYGSILKQWQVQSLFVLSERKKKEKEKENSNERLIFEPSLHLIVLG